MVDVSDLESYCTFDDERVYLAMAIARSKDQPAGVDADVPTIRKVVTEAEAIQPTIDELEHAVSRFDARYRLYVTASARNVVDATFALRSKTDQWIRQLLAGDDDPKRQLKRLDSEFKSRLQSDECRDETTFLFDVDEASHSEMVALRDRVASHTTVRVTQETPNGYHVVTDPFDYNRLETEIEYELKTDGMLFLRFASE